MSQNKAMERLRVKGECIDVSPFFLKRGEYLLPEFYDDVDYYDFERDAFIWSIGEQKQTGEIYASTDCRYYLNPFYNCLFLR